MLLWALGVLLFGAVVAFSIQTACRVKGAGEKSSPATAPQGGTLPEATTTKVPGSNTALPTTPPTLDRRQTAVPQLQPRMALVIDDLGQVDLNVVSRLCSLNIPLTVAVLPFMPLTYDSARMAHAMGKEVILHMPMEPIGYPRQGRNPGPGAILFDQSETEVRHRVASAVKNIPFATGMNNHMGSRITNDTTRMVWILEEIKKNNWYFLDSRTDKDTVALKVARDLGIPSLERKVFLDDSLDSRDMAEQWERALLLARQEGQVVVIGHVHRETIEFLEKVLPSISDEIRFVRASELAQ
jgi:polysaccharide deacetylase 2 family uncharacterized protein YibQ